MNNIFLDMSFLKSMSLYTRLYIYMSDMNILYMMVVLIVAMVVFFFSYYYLVGEKNFLYFIVVLLIFSMTMLGLLLSNSMLMLFFSWDGLGISSFLLVNFYKNWTSMNNAKITFMMNRTGDVIMLMMFSFIFYNWIYSILSNEFMLLFILFLSITKSAQFPFMNWLPAAMAAPTPVSSLVHSSTLVTAGVVLLVLFSNIFNKNMLYLLLLISFITMFFSGLLASGETDFKKLVAYSTLSQMALLFMSVTSMKHILTLFHLFSHAFFKSMLFMSVGSFLHSSYSSQESRSNLINNKNSFINSLIVMISLMNLSGLLFLSGFYSKDFNLLFSNMMEYKFFIKLMFYIILSMTMNYCLKMFFSSSEMLLGMKMKENSIIMTIILMPLLLMSILLGNLFSMNYLFISELFYFNYENKLFFIFLLMNMMMFKSLNKFFLYVYTYSMNMFMWVYKLSQDLWGNRNGMEMFLMEEMTSMMSKNMIIYLSMIIHISPMMVGIFMFI